MIKVVILGSGNVAFHLTAQLIKTKLVKVVQVYNRNLNKIKYLQSETNITNEFSDLKEADIYILAVSDNAIAHVSSKINSKNKFIVHTSGSVDMNTLQGTSRKGVFYLLQTFSQNREIDFSNIPICIEAQQKKDEELLEKLAKSISNNYYYINSDQRKRLHIAAVFVNNFVNHLYHLGYEMCNENNIPFDILYPIIQETAAKITSLQPFDAQTGPAKRNDTVTIDKHIEMLPKIEQEIYTLLTNSIHRTYGKKL
jgi:predicted short-subunit dehydrogenase-like oxidoreductase (DUF2520 family)